MLDLCYLNKPMALSVQFKGSLFLCIFCFFFCCRGSREEGGGSGIFVESLFWISGLAEGDLFFLRPNSVCCLIVLDVCVCQGFTIIQSSCSFVRMCDDNGPVLFCPVSVYKSIIIVPQFLASPKNQTSSDEIPTLAFFLCVCGCVCAHTHSSMNCAPA